ncbi:hypothetical protein Scep_023122 [Stephania cephalantha]|uniref:Uncharacterized protein n=1 Tax=Stephania cephalantha TaxID=152367 RepID=A0AAP0EZH4_9MAGN
MAIRLSNVKLNLLQMTQPSWSATKGRSLKLVNCAPAEVNQQQEEMGIMCEPCGGKGWLLCDFCNGQKTNVKAPNKRIYRRCPSCRAVGYVLCSNCKVFKCVTFPDYSDCEPDNV